MTHVLKKEVSNINTMSNIILPLEIVNIILNHVTYLQNNICHTCHVRIKCTKDRIILNNWHFCDKECFLFV